MRRCGGPVMPLGVRAPHATVAMRVRHSAAKRRVPFRLSAGLPIRVPSAPGWSPGSRGQSPEGGSDAEEQGGELIDEPVAVIGQFAG